MKKQQHQFNISPAKAGGGVSPRKTRIKKGVLSMTRGKGKKFSFTSSRGVSKMFKKKWGVIIAILIVVALLNSHIISPLLTVGDVTGTGQQSTGVGTSAEGVGTPTSETGTPTGEVETPIGETPIEEVDTPTGEVETPVGEGETPTEEVDTPTGEGETPTEEVDTPTGEGETPTEEVDTPTVEPETPTEEPSAENDEQTTETINTQALFTAAEQANPNIWWETPTHTVTMPAAGNPYAWLRTQIQTARPSGSVVHLVLTSHMNTGDFGPADGTVVTVPAGVTVVLIGQHSNTAMSVLAPNDRRVVLNDTHDNNISRLFRVRGNSNERTALVFRNVVMQNGTASVYGRPATTPEPLALGTQTTAATQGGGLAIETGGHVILDNGTVIRNTTTNNNGSGVHVQAGGRLTMLAGTQIFNNLATNGGGILVQASATVAARFDMYGGEIFGNFATTGAGGGLFVSAALATANMRGGTIRDNRTGANLAGSTFTLTNGNNGGGVNVGNGTFNMSGGVISNNEGSNGGGINIGGTAVLNVSGNARVENNRALGTSANVGGGGGIHQTAGTLNLQGGTIRGNTAQQGGGIGITGTGTGITTLNMSGGVIYNNEAEQQGGGVAVTRVITLTDINHHDPDTSMNNLSQSIMPNFNMTGGEIRSNSAGEHSGVYYAPTFEHTVTGAFESNLDNIFTVAGNAVVNETIHYAPRVIRVRNGATAGNTIGRLVVNIMGNALLEDLDMAPFMSVQGGATDTRSNVFEFHMPESSTSTATINQRLDFSGVSLELGGTGGGNRTNRFFFGQGSGNLRGVDVLPRLSNVGSGINEVNFTVYGNGTIAYGSSTNGGGVRFEPTLQTTGGINRTSLSLMGNPTIRNNSATGNGGGIFYNPISLGSVNNQDSFTISPFREMGETSTISNNVAGAYGGGIYINIPNIILDVEGVNIIANSATNGGGVALNNLGISNVRNARIEENEATQSGGGIYLADTVQTHDTDLELYDVQINANRAERGGGLYLAENSEVRLNSSQIAQNNAIYGGGAYVLGTVTMESGTIDGNTATQDGGGVWVAARDANTQAEFIANGGLISNNVAEEGYGGGIFADHTDFSEIYQNIVPSGAYANVRTTANVRFAGNRAFRRPIAPPDNSLPHIAHMSPYVSLFAGHNNESPLNNYDINFMRSGFLSLLSVPSFDFGQVSIGQLNRGHYALANEGEPYSVEVLDNRGTYHGWTLNVRQEGEFVNEHGVTADLRIMLSNNHNPNSDNNAATVANNVELVPNLQTSIMWANEGVGSGTQIAQFGEVEGNRSTGVSLHVPNGTGVRAGRYQTSLTWTLSDVPGNN